MKETNLNQEKLKEILSDVYKRGNEIENMNVLNLIEEIKEKFEAIHSTLK